MAKSSLSAISPRSRGALRAPRLVERAELVRPAPSLANLWQLPALLASLALFTLAAYLFIDPQPAQGFQRQLAIARRDIDAQRYDAAIGRLNDLLASPAEPRDAAATRLLIAEAIDRQIQRNRRQESPQAHRRIITEIRAAYDAGIAPTTATSDRLARSHEALGEIDESAANFRRAVELLERDAKPEQAVPMRRGEIELLVAFGRVVSAQAALEQFLEVPGLSDDERAWALGELARLHIDAGRHAEARSLLAAASALSPDDAIRGQVTFRMGYAAWKVGEQGEARDHLELACQQLGAGHFLEAEACYLLGLIAQDLGELQEANAYFDRVLRDHAESRTAPRAQLAGGMVKLLGGDDARGVAQLASIAGEVALRPGLDPLRGEMIAGLQRAARILDNRGSHELALQLLDRERELAAEPTADLLSRRAGSLERLVLRMAAAVGADSAAAEQLLGLRKQAGEAGVAAAMRLRQERNPGYADALWKGVSFHEQAGEPAGVIAALRHFSLEYPDDPIAPEVLGRLGREYRVSGDDARAIESFALLRARHPRSAAAIEAAVPLAQALVAQGPEQFAEACEALRSVTEIAATPPDVRKSALWELGQVCYRSGQYADALAALEQFARLGADRAGPEGARLAFLMGDSLRKGAIEQLEEAARPEDPLRPNDEDAQLAAGRATGMDPSVRQALGAAKLRFDEAIELYRQFPDQEPIDGEYERLAYLYRAHCAFELGTLEEAVELYDAAARRYGDDPSTLAAYVQMASALAELGRPREAELASERAKWLLKRLGPDAMTDGRFMLSRDHWERWLVSAGDKGAG